MEEDTRRCKSIKMRELRTEDMQKCIDAYLNQSKTSLSYIKGSFSVLYDIAMERDICYKDYSKFLKLPKKKKVEIHPFTEEEVSENKESRRRQCPLRRYHIDFDLHWFPHLRIARA